ncbi:MAG: DedA family protein/thiosulfate sulfurtransferase GlpE [Nitrospirota bacterium]
MDLILEFLIRYEGIILFAVVLTEQIGIPIPAVPFLLAAGSLAHSGESGFMLSLGLAFLACTIDDLTMYHFGRLRGSMALGTLCRISLDPGTCIRRMEDLFMRYGIRSLFIAKFITGLGPVAATLSGHFGINILRFLSYGAIGSLAWVLTYLIIGYIFSDQLEDIAEYLARFGIWFLIFLATVMAGYIFYRYIRRQRILRELNIPKISTDDLKMMLDSNEDVMIFDLRSPLDIAASPYAIPGAIQISMEELKHRLQDIPMDKKVALYCACPNEATSATAALLLQKNGITKARPLAGGVEAWRRDNLPVEELMNTETPDAILGR